jgi:ABC-type multidrug transport system fused ATPase/permease subunit
LIQLTLTTALSASTVLTVAHRLDTIAQSDKVLVMDDGTAAEFGHPDDLLSDPNSHFFALWHGHKHKKS